MIVMISWIIIGRNWGTNISELFTCIEKQTAEKNLYEIIFVDDCSNDNSNQIVKNYAQKNKHLFFDVKTNKGRGACRNIGIKHAKGDWCVFSNSNTYPEARFISKYIKQINYDNSSILVGSIDYTCHEDKLFESYLNNKKRGINKIKIGDRVPLKFVLFGNCAIKKTCLVEIQFDESILLYGGEELDLLFRMKHKYKNIQALKIDTSVLRLEHPSLQDHCKRMIEFGYNLKYFHNKKILNHIVSNKMLFVLKFLPIDKLIYLLNRTYSISPNLYTIKLILGIYIVKGIYSKKLL